MIIAGICIILLSPLMCVFATPMGGFGGLIIGIALLSAGFAKRQRKTKGFRVPRQRFEEVYGHMTGGSVVGKEFPHEVVGMHKKKCYEVVLVEENSIVIREVDN